MEGRLPEKLTHPQPHFSRCPVPDGGTCADEKVMQLLGNLIQELEDGRVAEWHWGWGIVSYSDLRLIG